MNEDGASPWWSCAARSRELDEHLAGSAVEATGWIAVEHVGAWSPAAPSSEELGPAAAVLAAPGVRLQLIRRPRRARVDDDHETSDRTGEGLTVLLGHAATDPAQRWLRRVVVSDPTELVTVLHPRVTTSPTSPAVGEEVSGDVWLVCTHGRRDACCAVHGRPVAAALRDADVEVWETTHTGGHRFAATAVVLPDGLSLGRLDDVDPVSLAADMAGGSLPPNLLRGRCSVPRIVQAAEALSRRSLDVVTRDGLLPLDWTTSGDSAAVVLGTPTGDERWTAVVRGRAVDDPRPVSDTAAPTTPLRYELRSMTGPGPSTSPPRR